jgi:hypothetical protein
VYTSPLTTVVAVTTPLTTVNFDAVQLIKWMLLIPPIASLQSKVNPDVNKQAILP